MNTGGVASLNHRLTSWEASGFRSRIGQTPGIFSRTFAGELCFRNSTDSVRGARLPRFANRRFEDTGIPNQRLGTSARGGGMPSNYPRALARSASRDDKSGAPFRIPRGSDAGSSLRRGVLSQHAGRRGARALPAGRRQRSQDRFRHSRSGLLFLSTSFFLPARRDRS